MNIPNPSQWKLRPSRYLVFLVLMTSVIADSDSITKSIFLAIIGAIGLAAPLIAGDAKKITQWMLTQSFRIWTDRFVMAFAAMLIILAEGKEKAYAAFLWGLLLFICSKRGQ